MTRWEDYLRERVAPRVRADGGWLDYAGEEGRTLRLTAKGECARCAALDRCLKWVADGAEKQTGVRPELSVTREPFLWRK